MMKNCVIPQKQGASWVQANKYDIIEVLSSEAITNERKANKIVGIIIN